jgi:hypothetical protein
VVPRKQQRFPRRKDAEHARKTRHSEVAGVVIRRAPSNESSPTPGLQSTRESGANCQRSASCCSNARWAQRALSWGVRTIPGRGVPCNSARERARHTWICDRLPRDHFGYLVSLVIASAIPRCGRRPHPALFHVKILGATDKRAMARHNVRIAFLPLPWYRPTP